MVKFVDAETRPSDDGKPAIVRLREALKAAGQARRDNENYSSRARAYESDARSCLNNAEKHETNAWVAACELLGMDAKTADAVTRATVLKTAILLIGGEA